MSNKKFIVMTDNTEQQESRREEHQDLEQQQQSLFTELTREQREAEKALQEDQERSGSAKGQDERDE
jgi:hypothetical protein